MFAEIEYESVRTPAAHCFNRIERDTSKEVLERPPDTYSMTFQLTMSSASARLFQTLKEGATSEDT